MEKSQSENHKKIQKNPFTRRNLGKFRVYKIKLRKTVHFDRQTINKFFMKRRNYGSERKKQELRA